MEQDLCNWVIWNKVCAKCPILNKVCAKCPIWSKICAKCAIWYKICATYTKVLKKFKVRNWRTIQKKIFEPRCLAVKNLRWRLINVHPVSKTIFLPLNNGTFDDFFYGWNYQAEKQKWLKLTDNTKTFFWTALPRS